MIRYMLVVGLLAGAVSFAKPPSETSKLQALVQAVKQASGDQRRQAMNALKLYLRTMKQAHRAEAIARIKQSLRHGTHKPMHSPAKMHKTLPSMGESSMMRRPLHTQESMAPQSPPSRPGGGRGR